MSFMTCHSKILGAPPLRVGGPPSGLGYSPRYRTAPSRLRRGVGRHKAIDIMMKREALFQYLGERSDNSLRLTLQSGLARGNMNFIAVDHPLRAKSECSHTY